ncbi:unnamed protein product [Didymodactylos carnosus]|nr:unnamed protein product [Didymodactylos carnosus]CAF3700944.1 unnamed protein product [Didymodactylos carnosus]
MADQYSLSKLSTATAKCKMCEEGVCICRGCKKMFCEDHFTQHRQQLAVQLDKVIYDHDIIQQELTSSTSPTTNLNNIRAFTEIDQWEKETIKKVKAAAQEARFKALQLSSRTMNDIKTKFELVSKTIRVKKGAKSYAEPDLNRWEQELEEINQDLCNEKLNCALTVYTKNIEWPKMIEVELQQIPSTKVRFDKLSVKASASIDIVPGGYVGLASSNDFVLYVENNHKNLSLINRLCEKTTIAWNNIEINDMCWSSYLSKFIILTDSKLFTFDATEFKIIEIKLNKSLTEKAFWNCSCTEQTLLMICDEWKSS